MRQIKNLKGDEMGETYLDEFKREMAPAEKLYAQEIKEFAKNYDFLGEMKIIERPDIDTLDYIYTFENLKGASKEVLRKALKEFYAHMKEFSKENGIYEFSRNAIISFDSNFDECY